MSEIASEAILIFAPTGRDAEAASALLGREGFGSRVCASLDGLCDDLRDGRGGVVIAAEEGLAQAGLGRLSAWLDAQPPWSDLPFIVLTSNTPTTRRRLTKLQLPKVLGNVTFLERPLHAFTLVSAAQAAVRARRRQSQVRNHLADREKAAEHQQLLIHELNHRVKNSLATVQAIAQQTLRGSDVSDAVRQTFTERLIALAKAHDILTERNWQDADLGAVVARALEPHGGADQARFRLKGPPVRVPPKATLALAMALHELATNAAKYGALSMPSGCVEIDWTVTGMEGIRSLQLRWEEKDGPPVATPSHRGFGSRLIERALAAELGGEAQFTFQPTGVICTIDAILANTPTTTAN